MEMSLVKLRKIIFKSFINYDLKRKKYPLINNIIKKKFYNREFEKLIVMNSFQSNSSNI